ncbi:MAG: hypothetical protein QOI92_2366 [Chloroflexota bacterium]|nr:hypothetical protein [Chloroflexota bacterium]
MIAVRRRTLILIVALAMAACQSAPTATGPAASGPAGSGASGSSVGPGASASSANSQPPASGFVAGDGDLFLDPMEAIDSLASHTASLTWTFDGTANGQPSTWTETTTLRTGTQPATAELLIERSNMPDLPQRAWLARTGGSVFSAVGDGACSAALPDPGRNPFVEPAGQLSALIGGSQTGTEALNGIQADVFQFDGKAMGLLDPTTATGRAWISPSDNLLLRYDVDIAGSGDYFGDGVTGHLTGKYELSDMHANVTVDVPATCPAGLIVGPQPTDAKDVVAVPGRTELSTAMTVKQATAFYHDTSLAFGWTLTGAPKTQDDGAALRFSQTGLDIFVVITRQGAASSVVVTATRA